MWLCSDQLLIRPKKRGGGFGDGRHARPPVSPPPPTRQGGWTQRGVRGVENGEGDGWGKCRGSSRPRSVRPQAARPHHASSVREAAAGNRQGFNFPTARRTKPRGIGHSPDRGGRKRQQAERTPPPPSDRESLHPRRERRRGGGGVVGGRRRKRAPPLSGPASLTHGARCRSERRPLAQPRPASSSAPSLPDKYQLCPPTSTPEIRPSHPPPPEDRKWQKRKQK
ncbi:serine/arginine repetitive matrix protein 1-like [Pristis pectinata]|uniref:serine/arginine repetitive matrix protein 1-like n=1 Tax=Pristis pectinata TaxID=685728 RepID=UPI00223CA1C3|nr:serine/arginine repetitive matrix protein 1-like [Pristis pectinata]